MRVLAESLLLVPMDGHSFCLIYSAGLGLRNKFYKNKRYLLHMAGNSNTIISNAKLNPLEKRFENH